MREYEVVKMVVPSGDLRVVRLELEIEDGDLQLDFLKAAHMLYGFIQCRHSLPRATPTPRAGSAGWEGTW